MPADAPTDWAHSIGSFGKTPMRMCEYGIPWPPRCNQAGEAPLFVFLTDSSDICYGLDKRQALYWISSRYFLVGSFLFFLVEPQLCCYFLSGSARTLDPLSALCDCD